jgi:stress responsive alpha/beta barrel protein
VSVQHVVLLRFPAELDAEDLRAFRATLAGMPGTVGGFRALRFGTERNGGARARGYQYLMYSEHDDPPSLAAYLAHPAHRALGAWVADRGGELLAFDYELDDTTVLL